jgi:hypothetical protein
MVSLNIGCGGTQKYPFKRISLGDFIVNADIQKPQVCIKDFVLCDGRKLPFKSQTFTELYAAHIIEHMANPTRFVEECKRVSKKVIIVTPNLYSIYSFIDSDHTQHFTMFTLKMLLTESFGRVEIKGDGAPWGFHSMTFFSNTPTKGKENTLPRFYLNIGRKVCMFLTRFLTPVFPFIAENILAVCS